MFHRSWLHFEVGEGRGGELTFISIVAQSARQTQWFGSSFSVAKWKARPVRLNHNTLRNVIGGEEFLCYF